MRNARAFNITMTDARHIWHACVLQTAERGIPYIQTNIVQGENPTWHSSNA